MTIELTGEVHVGKDTDQLFDDLGRYVSGIAARAVDRRGVFHMALSGGSTPEPFYMRLVIDPDFRAIPWEQTPRGYRSSGPGPTMSSSCSMPR